MTERKKRGFKPRPIEERFWPKVSVAGPDECWLWNGAVGSHGYGHMAMRPGNSVTAHRIAWNLTHGAIPDGLYVMHRCDVKRCCNPAHLMLGTPKDNSDDMFAKGRARHAVGEQASKVKLTDAQCFEIKRLVSSGVKYAHAATRYGVAASTVSQIVRGKSRRYLALGGVS